MKIDQSLFAGVVEDALSRGEAVVLRVQGASMLPWLREGDPVRILPATGRRPRRGDIVLFLRAPERPVLHRVVAVHATGGGQRYDCLGDAEHGVPERVEEPAILGVAAIPPWRRAAWRMLHRPRHWLNRLLVSLGVRWRHG